MSEADKGAAVKLTGFQPSRGSNHQGFQFSAMGRYSERSNSALFSIATRYIAASTTFIAFTEIAVTECYSDECLLWK